MTPQKVTKVSPKENIFERLQEINRPTLRVDAQLESLELARDVASLTNACFPHGN